MKMEDLIGAWNLVSWTRKCVEDQSISYPFGKNPTGQLELTEEKISVIVYKDNMTFLNVPTIDDYLAKPDVKEFSYSGKYVLQEEELVALYESCSDNRRIGQKKIARLWFDGHNTLIFFAKDPVKINEKHYIPSATWIKQLS